MAGLASTFYAASPYSRKYGNKGTGMPDVASYWLPLSRTAIRSKRPKLRRSVALARHCPAGDRRLDCSQPTLTSELDPNRAGYVRDDLEYGSRRTR